MIKIIYREGHIKALDGIRGLAVIFVVLFHCFSFAPTIIKQLVGFGWIGVDLFFVLSGFLITGILLESKHNANYYQNFFMRRLLRIFPLYYFVLIIFFSAYKLFHLHQFDYLWKIKFYFFTYTQNILFAFRGFVGGFFSHFWSLAIEEQFYIFWPLCILRFSNKNILRICIVGILASIITRNIFDHLFHYVFTLSRMDALLIGASTAILIRDRKEWLNTYTLFIFLGLLVIIALIFFLAKGGQFWHPYWSKLGYTIIDIFFGCILIFIFDTGKVGWILNKFFELKILTFIGKYSYGIYVYHCLLNAILPQRLSKIIIFIAAPDTLLNQYIILCILLLVTILVSYFSYHLFEKQFLKLKKYFPAKAIPVQTAV